MGTPGRGLQDPWGRWALISGSAGGADIRGHRGLRGLVRWAGGRELNRGGSVAWLGRVHGGTFRGTEAQAGVSAGDREEKVVSQQRHCSGNAPVPEGNPHCCLLAETCIRIAGGSQGGARSPERGWTPAAAPLNECVKIKLQAG